MEEGPIIGGGGGHVPADGPAILVPDRAGDLDEDESAGMLPAVLVTLVALSFLAKLLLPRFLAALLERCFDVRLEESHFRLLQMRLTGLQLRQTNNSSRRGRKRTGGGGGGGWHIKVEEVGLGVNSNFGSQEGIFQLKLKGVRIRREATTLAAASAAPSPHQHDAMVADEEEEEPDEEDGWDDCRRYGDGSALARLEAKMERVSRVVDRYFLHKAVAAVTIEVQDVEVIAGGGDGMPDLAVSLSGLSFSKVQDVRRVRLFCKDVRVSASGLTSSVGAVPLLPFALPRLLCNIHCPSLEVHASPDDVTVDKFEVHLKSLDQIGRDHHAAVKRVKVERVVAPPAAEEGDGAAAASPTAPASVGMWSADATGMRLSQEGAFAAEVRSVSLSRCEQESGLLTPQCLVSSIKLQFSAFSGIPLGVSLVIHQTSLMLDKCLAVVQVASDRVALRKDDAEAPPLLDLRRITYADKDSEKAVALTDARVMLTQADVTRVQECLERSAEMEDDECLERRPSKQQQHLSRRPLSVQVSGLDCRFEAGQEHRSLVRLASERASWQSAVDAKSRLVMEEVTLKLEPPPSSPSSHARSIVEKLALLKFLHSKDKGLQVVARDALNVHWHPGLHLSLLESARAVGRYPRRPIMRKLAPSATTRSPLQRSASVMAATATVRLHCGLTTVVVRATDPVVFATSGESYLRASGLAVGIEGLCDKDLISIDSFMTTYSRAGPADVRTGLLRGAGFQKPVNTTIKCCVDTCQVFLPFQVDLHKPLLGDIVAHVKWLKLRHLEGREATSEASSSSSHPDVLVYLKGLSLKVEDDPFEVSLRENYSLLEDEHYESMKRRELLDRKMEELRHSHSSFLSSAKVEELYSTLKRRDTELYIKRAKGIKAKPDRPPSLLMQVNVTNIKLHLLSDPSMDAVDSSLVFIERCEQSVADGASCLNDLELDTHIFRWLHLQAEKAVVTLRDFDLAVLATERLSLAGRILFADELPHPTEIYRQHLHNDEFWSDVGGGSSLWVVQRSVKSLKLYSDLTLEADSLSACMGPCLDPVLGQLTISLSYLLGRRSKDPSPPLPWWDKIRFYLHGHLAVSLRAGCRLFFLTTMDPYNVAEKVELSCRRCEVVLSHVEDFSVDCSDLDLIIQTASKYEDCKLLHVPRLRLRLLLAWQCRGDPRRHFNVRLRSSSADQEAGGGGGGRVRKGSVVAVGGGSGGGGLVMQQRDSFADFRSSGFEMTVRVRTLADKDGGAGDGRREAVSVEMFSSTLKWVEELMRSSVLSTTSPPIRKGRLFGCEEGWKKKTLFRHLKAVRVESFVVHRLELNYWTSILQAEGVQLTVEKGMTFEARYSSQRRPTPKESLIRRPALEWTNHASECCVSESVVRLQQLMGGGDGGTTASSSSSGGGKKRRLKRHFFLSIQKVQFKMQQKSNEHLRRPLPNYQFIVTGANCAWTIPNRDLVFSLYENWWRDQKLREQLSRDVLTKSEDSQQQQQEESLNGNNRSFRRKRTVAPSHAEAGRRVRPHPRGELSWSVIDAWEGRTEVVKEEPPPAITGGDLSLQADVQQQQQSGHSSDQESRHHVQKEAVLKDAIFESWLVKFENCQVLLKGRNESSGHVVFCSPKAEVRRNVHSPQWNGETWLRKTSWSGVLTDLQYFATVAPQFGDRQEDDEDDGEGSEVSEDKMPAPVNISPRPRDNQDDDFSHLSFVPFGCTDLSDSVGGAVSYTSGLQRIVSRCRCDFYYLSYDEEDLPDDRIRHHLVHSPDEAEAADQTRTATQQLLQEEDFQCVNTFSLVHQDLYVSTNSLQYSVIMDVLNNLLLYLEPMALSRAESYLRLKYQLMLSNPKDLKRPIVQLQHSVKQVMHELRMKEKLLHQMRMGQQPTPDSEADAGQQQRLSEHDLELEVQRLGALLSAKANELSVHVSCLHDTFIAAAGQQQQQQWAQQQVPLLAKKRDELWKRWTLTFSRAEWRLTETDGQLGIADVAIANLSYSKSVMRDDATEHLLEMSDLSVKNLLKNQSYVDVLFPTRLRNVPLDRQRSIRIFCRERPPVGGISVKDHFEVNVVPLSIGITQSFYKKIMEFCFPESNKEQQQRQQQQQGSDKKKGSVGSSTNSNFYVASELLPSDDVEQMRERAKLNKLFTYIKIPAVPICVSFRGDRDSKGRSRTTNKLLDVENFLLQVPMLEYHNVTWTWLDFLMAVKSQTKDSLLSQAIKKKLTLRSGRRSAAASGSQEQQQAGSALAKTEQEKSKMLLGNL